MNIGLINFKSAHKFGYDDEMSSMKRVSMRKHLEGDTFIRSDIFRENNRLEEYRLNQLIKKLTKKDPIRENKKSQINFEIMNTLPLYNVEPIYGTSSYRGSTFNLDDKTIKKLKEAGVEGIICFIPYELDEYLVEKNGLDAFCYPISPDFWGAPGFQSKEDVIWDVKLSYNYQEDYISQNELIKQEIEDWEEGKKYFINDFVDFINEMKKPNRYVGCMCGTETTNEILTLNYFFNPEAKDTHPYYLVHIIISVIAEATAEDHILFRIGKFLVFFIQIVVPVIVYRIIRLVTLFPCDRILSGYNRIFSASEFKMLMLYYSCIRDLFLSVIDHGITLIIALSFEQFMLESE